MPRNVVYSSPRPPADVYSGAPYSPGDEFGERLVKFIPAEVLAFFVPAAANWGDDKTALVLIFVLATVATPLYLWVMSDTHDKPRKQYYVLATLSFVAWAIGTSPPASDLIGLAPDTGSLALFLAAFAIPLIDRVIEKLQNG